ncbi:MAG: hypothetical protein ORN21_05465, partial [Methylophilaceae bacterium]|nr:hypothetical protein [Methylophilaceae bacterium]
QVLVKGDDYQEQDIIGGKEVKSWGGVVKRIALLPGRSTTNTIERLKGTFAKVGERDEVQGVRNTGGETYQRDRRASE